MTAEMKTVDCLFVMADVIEWAILGNEGTSCAQMMLGAGKYAFNELDEAWVSVCPKLQRSVLFLVCRGLPTKEKSGYKEQGEPTMRY